jgi:2-polyprenyl-6-methoxyphenol hydroxylase-like FAD-dependent oxidoreductase
MSGIAIVGAGISGLHLALRLQQAGMPTTLYAERSPEDVAAGPPPNLAVRFEHTRARDRQLGVAPWDEPEYGMYGVNFAAAGDPPLDFWGGLTHPGSSIDFRVYLPHLMASYAERGGAIEILAPDPEAITTLATRHDLVVVASGRRSVTQLFPRDPSRSPYTAPQRMITAALYLGIGQDPRNGLEYHLCPGVGEIFSIAFHTQQGTLRGINIEAIPGGPLEYLSTLSYEKDPRAFRTSVLKELAEHAPSLRERIDEHEFDLPRPRDVIQGGITPTVRAGWAALPEGYAVAVGDAWVVNDPVTGQGANLGSHSAFALAEEILAGGPYDEAFCRRAEARMWEWAGPVTEWTNSFLLPPPPHALELLGAAGQDRRIADAFIDLFNDPVTMWKVLGSPDGTATWLRSFG